MCWISKRRFFNIFPPKRHIAKEDIPVKKLCLQDFYSLRTPFRGEPIYGSTLRADYLDLPRQDVSKHWYIDHGIHSYAPHIDLEFLLKEDFRAIDIQAYIPKGTAYYFNGNEYVSEQIKFY